MAIFHSHVSLPEGNYYLVRMVTTFLSSKTLLTNPFADVPIASLECLVTLTLKDALPFGKLM